MPFVLVAGIVGLGANRWHERQLAQAAVYDRAEAAVAAGDFDAAIFDFSVLGDFRDAEDRLAAVQAAEQPVREALSRAQATFDSGDYASGIAMLEAVAQEAPGYGPAAAQLDASREIWIAQLTHDIPVFLGNQNWLGAELALRQLSVLRPEDTTVADQLADVVRDHAPLVFVRGGAVFLDGPKGNQEERLTPAMGAAFPSWSPDRSHIAFIAISEDAGRFDGTLMLMDGDGTDLHAVALDVLPNSWPVWSPDGSRIAFSSVRGYDSETFTGTVALHLYTLDTGQEIDLTGGQVPYAASPSWSPDGTQIVFVSNTVERGFDGGIKIRDGDVYKIDAAGGEARVLTGDRMTSAFWVQWSPAGDRLLIMTAPGDWASPAKSHIFLLDFESDELTELPVDEWQISLPFWSPDGSQIAFVTGTHSLVVWSDAGLRSVELWSEVAPFASWSPDGRYLLAPPGDATHRGYVLDVSEAFGAITEVDLDFDRTSSPTGMPLWSGVTPLPESALPALPA